MRAPYFYVFSLLGGIVVVGAGIAVGSTWLIFCGCVGPLVSTTLVAVGRRRMLGPHPNASNPVPGARVVTPTALPPLPPSGFRWTGGCNVPSTMGRFNATFPLGMLVAAPGWARIEVRPRLAQRLVGYQPTTFETNAATNVFPVRGPLGSSGIGFQTGHQPPFYFWTTNQPTILTALAGCGFSAGWQEVRAKTW